MNEKTYDIIVVGGGPAGLTAGLYAARGGMKALLIEKMGFGGQAVITDFIENYPGFPDGASGYELAAKMQEQAIKFGLETCIEEVKTIENLSGAVNGKKVTTSENTYLASAIVLSTGANFKHLNVPGEDSHIGKGVSYCATCDGPFFKGKDIVVIGGGDSAVQEASFLAKFANSVTIVHRRERLRAAQWLQDRIKSNQKIKYKFNSVVEKITGKECVESVAIKDVNSGKTEEYKTSGVFIFVGHTPNTSFLGSLVKTNEAGYIITDDDMQTSSAGIFACGDSRKKLLKQVVTACGDGAVASFAAQEYVENIKGSSYNR
jgi:thioredoxin reductase (NADPH)